MILNKIFLKEFTKSIFRETVNALKWIVITVLAIMSILFLINAIMQCNN